ncbi:GNAT family N-acetyltransferase [Halomonas sp. LS-001]
MNNREEWQDQLLECPAQHRQEALLSLAAAQNRAGRQALASAVQAFTQQPSPDWSGLLCHADPSSMRAVWVQPFPGSMAQLWQPQGDDAITQALLQAARAWVDAHAIRLCHTLVTPEQQAQALPLKTAGMQLISPLHYLTMSVQTPPAKPTELTLRPWCELGELAALSLIKQVQVESLDSPLVCQALGSKGLLEGFYRQSPEGDRHWFSLHHASQPDAPVGALLMAPRSAHKGIEVMLMGLVPSMRGQGLGRDILQAALRYAEKTGAERVMLTVDATNTPARQLYEREGFHCYHQEDIYAWTYLS